MKILIINDFKEIVGGAEINMYDTMNEFIKRGHTVKLFSGDFTFKESKNKFKYFKLLNLLFDFHYLFKFKEMINKFKPDIIHIHNIFYELSPSFLILLKSYTTVMTVHDNQLFSPVSLQNSRTGKNCKRTICPGCSNCIGFKGAIYEHVKRKIFKILARNIDYYIGNSTYINNIISKMNLGKTIDLKYAVKLFNASKLQYTNNLLFVGRLVKEKGIFTLLKAMSIIIAKDQNVKLTIIGEGNERDNIIKYIQDNHLSKNVKLLDKISRDDVEKYYISNDITIIPSTWNEPFCLVGIESLSVGRPVIGSNIGGIPEWLTNGYNGYLVKPDVEQEIANAVIHILNDKKLLDELSINSVKSAEQYSFGRYIDELEKIFIKSSMLYSQKRPS